MKHVIFPVEYVQGTERYKYPDVKEKFGESFLSDDGLNIIAEYIGDLPLTEHQLPVTAEEPFITFSELLDLFGAKAEAVYINAETSAKTRIFIDKARAKGDSRTIDLNSKGFTKALAHLVTEGVLTQSEADNVNIGVALP